MSAITIATRAAQLRRCYPVIAQLRPHLDEAGFIARVRRQQKRGYRLAFLADRNGVKAVAGYRFAESLSWGKFMYVDDLVTAEAFRSRGFGQKLLAWLVKQARAAGC